MIALCVASTEGSVGKTALCSAISRRLQTEGKKVGYFKPVTIRREGAGDKETYRDCQFLSEVLGLAAPVEATCPSTIGQNDFASGKGALDPEKLKDAYAAVSKDKDVMIIEGLSGLGKASMGGKLMSQILALIPAKLLAVHNGEASSRAEMAAMSPDLKSALIGVVINGVSAKGAMANNDVAPAKDAPVFAVIPQDRALAGLSVGEIAEALKAQEMVPGQGAGELVQNVMIGAATLDPGASYFGRKSNKAVLVRGERPDMQLAALGTPTTALILTGGGKPIGQVAVQARLHKVPILVVQQDTHQALDDISDAIQKARFSQRQKLERLDEILATRLDFKGLYKALGL